MNIDDLDLAYSIGIPTVPNDFYDNLINTSGKRTVKKNIPIEKIDSLPIDKYIYPKLDGVNIRCFLTDNDELKVYTRGGKDISNKISKDNILDFSSIEMLKNKIYTGELVIKHADSQRLMTSLVNSKEVNIQTRENSSIVLFDFISPLAVVKKVKDPMIYYGEFINDFPCDGIIVSAFDDKYAFKPEPIIHESTVTQIIYNRTAKRGKVPILLIDPVFVKNTKIERLSMYSILYLSNSGVKEGDKIVFKTSNTGSFPIFMSKK